MLRVCPMRDAICPHGMGCPYVGDGPYGYPCKEGWDSRPSPRIPAMPSEELTYGQKLIAEAIEAHFGERVVDYDEDVDDTSNHDAWEAFDAMFAPHPAPTAADTGGLVERLEKAEADCVHWAKDYEERGKAHETIRAMREALAVFTRHYEPWMDEHVDDVQVSSFARHTFGELRRARTLAKEMPDGQ